MNIIEVSRVDFPEKLRSIDSPPERLYCIGDISLLATEPTVAVVGARRATEYGKWAARTVSRRLAEKGVCIVSGMAEGADTAAHMGALESGGKTIAVLGCGIDICYPAGNRRLKKDIEKNGLVISEYSPGTPAGKYTFPQRNRIISALSASVVVAEAGISSGSLITAEIAADQGREVYAIPGNINRLMSAGTNKLIRDGARPLVLIEDLLADMGLKPTAAQSSAPQLAAEEKEVYELAVHHGEISIDEIAGLLLRPVHSLTATVTLLEMKGCIAYEKGKIFALS